MHVIRAVSSRSQSPMAGGQVPDCEIPPIGTQAVVQKHHLCKTFGRQADSLDVRLKAPGKWGHRLLSVLTRCAPWSRVQKPPRPVTWCQASFVLPGKPYQTCFCLQNASATFSEKEDLLTACSLFQRHRTPMSHAHAHTRTRTHPHSRTNTHTHNTHTHIHAPFRSLQCPSSLPF